MPERYRCFKEIDYMFKDLRGRIIEKNQKIKETAHWYIVNQAVYDLEKYRASLPSEAVYEICYCLKERAGLLEYKPDQYQWNEFLKDMRSAQMLYQENGLLADSALCALNIMDEGLAEFNIDSEYKPLYLDTIKISLQEVEKILPELMEHPVLNEIYLRLSMYCFSIDDIERSKHYYESFQRLGNFAIDHFAPWLRGRYDSDNRTLKFRLSEFKDELTKEFNLRPMSEATWERQRDGFLDRISTITEARAKECKNTDESDQQHMPTVGQDDVGRIPVEPAFLLVYAAEGNGQIFRLATLGSAVQVSTDGKQFMADNSQRESARWQEALDLLITWGWVKPVGRKGEVYEVTGTGYTKADWLKDDMCIDTSKEPLEELKQFEF